jgi:hypothetical protein
METKVGQGRRHRNLRTGRRMSCQKWTMSLVHKAREVHFLQVLRFLWEEGDWTNRQSDKRAMPRYVVENADISSKVPRTCLHNMSTKPLTKLANPTYTS